MEPHLCSTSTTLSLTIHHLLSMSCTNITSPAHYQLEFHLFYPCTVSTSSLLSSSNQKTYHLYGHVQSEYHLSYISHTLVQSHYHIICPCPFSIPPLLLKSSQYTTLLAHVTISPAHVHSEYQKKNLKCIYIHVYLFHWHNACYDSDHRSMKL